MSYGNHPIIFTKPAGKVHPLHKAARPEAHLHLTDALAGPFEDIPVHPECFSMDYEVPSSLLVCIIRTVAAGLDAPG